MHSSSKMQVSSDEKRNSKQRKPKPLTRTVAQQTRQAGIPVQTGADVRLLKPAAVLRLQRSLGNKVVRRLMEERAYPDKEQLSAGGGPLVEDAKKMREKPQFVQKYVMPRNRQQSSSINEVIHRVPLQKDKLNVIGEFHKESGKNLGKEKIIAAREVGGFYKGEPDFEFHPLKGVKFEGAEEITDHKAMADPLIYRVAHRETFLVNEIKKLTALLELIPGQVDISAIKESIQKIRDHIPQIKAHIDRAFSEPQEKDLLDDTEIGVLGQLYSTDEELKNGLMEILLSLRARQSDKFDQGAKTKMQEGIKILRASAEKITGLMDQLELGSQDDIKKLRDLAMHNAAQQRSNEPGVWKIGNRHAQSMKDTDRWKKSYHLMTRDDFYEDANYKKELGG